MNQQADDTDSYTNCPVWEQECEILHTSFATLNRVKQTCVTWLQGYLKFQVVYNQNILNNAQTFSFKTFVSGKNTYATKNCRNPKKADGTSISSCR